MANKELLVIGSEYICTTDGHDKFWRVMYSPYSANGVYMTHYGKRNSTAPGNITVKNIRDNTGYAFDQAYSKIGKGYRQTINKIDFFVPSRVLSGAASTNHTGKTYGSKESAIITVKYMLAAALMAGVRSQAGDPYYNEVKGIVMSGTNTTLYRQALMSLSGLTVEEGEDYSNDELEVYVALSEMSESAAYS